MVTPTNVIVYNGSAACFCHNYIYFVYANWS